MYLLFPVSSNLSSLILMIVSTPLYNKFLMQIINFQLIGQQVFSRIPLFSFFY